MKPVSLAIAILAIGLAISGTLNFWQFNSNQQLGATLQESNQRLDSLNQSLIAVNQTYTQMVADAAHFNAQANQDSIFMTPITKSQAIRIALAYGGWNATLLRGQTVEAWLDHVSRNNSYIGFGGHFGITRVTVSEPQANYSRLIDGEMEHWFEWVVMIRGEESDFHHTGYYIDAETGEVLMIMGMNTLTLTDEMISNPNDPITMQVGKTFAITLESQPVSLFTYLGYENQVIAVMTPSATLFIKDPDCVGGHLFSIEYDIFRVVAMVANTGNGLLLIHDVFVNGTAIYQNPSFPL